MCETRNTKLHKQKKFCFHMHWLIHHREARVILLSDDNIIGVRNSAVENRVIGASPSGKAPDFDSGIRRFESSRSIQNRIGETAITLTGRLHATSFAELRCSRLFRLADRTCPVKGRDTGSNPVTVLLLVRNYLFVAQLEEQGISTP